MLPGQGDQRLPQLLDLGQRIGRGRTAKGVTQDQVAFLLVADHPLANLLFDAVGVDAEQPAVQIIQLQALHVLVTPGRGDPDRLQLLRKHSVAVDALPLPGVADP